MCLQLKTIFVLIFVLIFVNTALGSDVQYNQHYSYKNLQNLP